MDLIFCFKRNVLLFIATIMPVLALANSDSRHTIVLQKGNGIYNVEEYAEFINDENSSMNINILQKAPSAFRQLDSLPDYDAAVHWLRFHVYNPDTVAREIVLSISFTDYITLYSRAEGALRYLEQKTGDLVPLDNRDMYFGQMVAIKSTVGPGQTMNYLARLESTTTISRQFKKFALNSVRVYNKGTFNQRFFRTRIYQAFFYGALLIMLLYNVFISFTLRSSSYLYYVVFLGLLTLFLASNNGFIAELFIPSYPRIDLYIRFLSGPIVVMSMLCFGRSYLQVSSYDPVFRKISNYFLAALGTVALSMLAGNWFIGRNLTIFLAIPAFVSLFIVSIRVYRKGFAPARYFLVANGLLLLGGIVFAVTRYFTAVYHPFTQYSLQVAAILQVALFSVGLADRINLVRRQLAGQIMENKKKELERERERTELILQKNRELEEKVKERTEEVLIRNTKLEENNEKLKAAEALIRTQNNLLEANNNKLEKQVLERTNALAKMNQELYSTNEELNTFIYRISHDLRGPSARLLGLCQLAITEIKDPEALEYFQKLSLTAGNLDGILKRLNFIYQIYQSNPEIEKIHFNQMIEEIQEEVKVHTEDIAVDFDVNIDKVNFRSDPKLTRFILHSLVENAVKFQRPESVNKLVHIRIKQDKEHLKIHVEDNGIGIADEDVPVLFNMFNRSAAKHQGVGLGLYMVKKCAEKLQGRVAYLRSEEGLTTFQVELPNLKGK